MEKLQVKKPLHPFICIISSIFVLVVGLIYAKNPIFPFYILSLCPLYCCFGLAKPTFKALAIFIPVGLIFTLFSWLFSHNIYSAFQVGGRVLLLGVSAIPMVTLPPIRLTRCLTQLGFPRVITLGMLVSIRFIPIVAEEVRRMRQAMYTRGASASFYRAFVVPVIVHLISISDTLALSLETRGFTLENNMATVYEPVYFSLRDGLYSAAILLLLIGMVMF